ncbi:Stp1/IreP family PP2C-type Ser/Thr phosphatase [candidate division KSB1 bacterium]|nr:Stp1/IreP family PP2C-type Ser/Thr phosphatase [candidate division KSB1 bacterium]
MRLEMVGLSDIGVTRKNNEDQVGIFPELNLGLICDGMGGHSAGAFASQLAIEILKSVYEKQHDQRISQLVSDVDFKYRGLCARVIGGLRLANHHIYNLALKNSPQRGMGTTVALVVFEPGLAILAHVGDSRIYRVRDRELSQLTDDHSWINELIQDREIKKEEARFFQKKNVITRALGMAPGVKIDLRIEPIENGDIFLLCSDGLTNSLNDDLIQAILVNYQPDLESVTHNLIDMAKRIDGSDNISVVLVKVLDAGNPSRPVTPSQTTIKEENSKIVSLENRIFRQNMARKSNNNFFFNLFDRYKNILLLLIGTILLVIFSLLLFK